MTVDVVVIGAGLAGNAAACTAAERGATVCLLEKGGSFGGSSVRAGGGLLFAGTDLQKKLGVDDDAERLRAAIVAAGQAKNDPVVVGAYVENQLDTYEWLCAHGIEFSLAPPNADVPTPRLHVTPQGHLTRVVHSRLVEMPNATYRPHTRARRLRRGDDGRVAGVAVTHDGVDTEIAARHGVIVASGGFSRSPELLQTFAPEWAGAVKMGGPDNTGDGLRMAGALGAQLVDMGYIEATFGASADDFHAGTSRNEPEPRLLFPHAAGAVVVNRLGRRFVNEGLNYKAIGRICADQPDGLGFQIFDRQVMERSQPVPTPRDYAGALADGLVVQAPTIGALARALGIDPGGLEATIAAYNDFVRARHDPDWGRPTAGGVTVEAPPFYGFPCRAGLTATYCGVKVDANLHVVDVFEEPIEGLYAAGEVVGGFHGAGYLTGTGLGKAAVFGHFAGRSVGRPAP
jgi:fumarate reductase flavoprotein subunit